MRIRLPLYAKIGIWFLLNLIFLGAVFYAFFKVQFRLGLDSLLLGQAGERIQAVSEVIADELNTTAGTSWNDVLKRFSNAYKAQFSVFGSDGVQVAGEPVSLPANLMARITDQRAVPAAPRRGPPPGRGPRRWLQSQSPGPSPKFILHTTNPDCYWIGARLALTDRGYRRPMPMTLLAMSPSLRGGGLFLDLTPWIAVGFGAVILSVLFWMPLLRGITRAISQMNEATEQIAEGRFTARVATRRTDELGRLGQAINRLAARLAGFVGGQKRFLGDIAHELCSPIARIQVALGILEQRAEANQRAYVEDVREEVQHVSGLVNELLSFSKAGLQPQEIKLEPVSLAPLARRVVAREAPGANQVEIQINEQLNVLAEPELLSRALANLVRNAVRYASQAGPIVFSAHSQAGQVVITVSDQGPGVAQEALSQIFDPFFRDESSRSRETGGVGLGLAIVKTCVEACQGTVTAKNRQPHGLQVELVLKAAPER